MNEPQLPCCLNQWKYLAKWQWCVAKCDCLHIYFSEIFQPEIEWTNLNSYSRVGITQFWHSLSFLLVLHWDDLHMLFSILKSFLALLGRLLMSLPTLPSCLTVLPRYMQLNSSVVGRSSLFTLTSEGFQHHFCLLLADLQAYTLCKQAGTGGFLLHVLISVWGHRRNPDLQGLRKGFTWCPLVGLMLFAASPIQLSGWRATLI